MYDDGEIMIWAGDHRRVRMSMTADEARRLAAELASGDNDAGWTDIRRALRAAADRADEMSAVGGRP